MHCDKRPIITVSLLFSVLSALVEAFVCVVSYGTFVFFLALFLAYTNGAAKLCRELLKAGGSLNTMNKHGVSVFNAQVPTKKLLYTLLGKKEVFIQ